MKTVFRYIWYFVYLVIQSTYGVLQNFLGFCLFLKLFKCKHEFYHGAILTYHNGNWGGISLGAFIFVNGNRPDDWVKPACVHEFGHTIQSLVLGPLYLIVIGLPSFIWCNSKKCINYRKVNNKSYYDLYCEKNANFCGHLVTGLPAPNPNN